MPLDTNALPILWPRTGALSLSALDPTHLPLWCARRAADATRAAVAGRGSAARHVAGRAATLQAQARLRELMTTVEPVAAVSDRLDVGEAGRRYVANMRDAGRKASSVKGVESTLRCWLVPYLGGRALDTITPDDVRDLMATMRNGSRKRKTGGVGPSTIRHTVATLSAIFNYASHAERRWATSNPCRSVTLPPAPRGRLRFLTPDELRLNDRERPDWAARARRSRGDPGRRDDGATPGRATRASLGQRGLVGGAGPGHRQLRSRRVRRAEVRDLDPLGPAERRAR
jgi:hypothetical protein